jgi:hypothetical protein
VETDELAQTAVIPAGRRMLIGLLWGLVQAVILFVLLFAGGLAAARLDQGIQGRAASSTAALFGVAVGVAAGLFVNHRARSWLLQHRLRRLRDGGVSVQATVLELDRQWFSSARGGSMTRYVVHVQWEDPITGGWLCGERRYRFFGRDLRLGAMYARGARIGLYYPAHRPSRFVIDGPFAPTMADLLG